MEKISLQQRIMNKAYKRFQTNRHWSMIELYFSMSPIEKIAVAIGNLNYQVENGGFLQWIDNGYSGLSENTLNYIFNDIKDKKYPLLKKVLSLAFQAIKNEDDDELRNKLDNEYYKINAGVLIEVDSYLKTIKNK